MMKFLAAVLMSGCAATNPSAYSGVMTKAECEVECGSRAYPTIGVQNGACICDTSRCLRPAHRGGCEPLPGAPSSNPTTQL